MAKSRRRSQKRQAQSISTWKQYLIGIFVLISVITFSAIYLLESATKPFVTVKEHATKVAQKYADIQDVSQVTIYNGKETYYNVQGKNQAGQDVYVLVPEESSEIYIYQKNEGISQAEAEQRASDNGATAIEKTVLGYRDGHAIWEVKSGRSYYVIDFKTGELIKREGV